MNLEIPDPALVLLVGPSGSGKSTFARRYFRSTQVVSSDGLRELLSDDAGDQSASAEAFKILAILVNGRLRRRLTTVVDATNLRAADRKRYLRVASRYGVPSVAIAFDLPTSTYLARNAGRPDRVVDDGVVTTQIERMAEALAALPTEGYAAVHRLREADLQGAIAVTRVPTG